MLRLLVILIISTVATSSFAQQVDVAADTILHTSDSIIVKKNGKIITVASYAKRYQPRKALLYAAVLPGSGQIYNKKYWKLPFVYGGFFLITTGVIYYNNLYIKYKDDLFTMINQGITKDANGHTQDEYRAAIDQARRQRDFFLIIDGFWYMLQMIDAHVDAHLREFDLNPQLKVSFSPNVQQNYLTGRMNGFSVTLKF